MIWLCHSDSERLLQGRRQRGSATAFETKIFGSGRRSSSESQHNNRGKKNNTNKKNTNKKKTKASKAKPLGECSKVERKKCCRANTFGPPKTYTSAKKYCQALNCKINNCPDNKPSKANKPRPKASKAKAEKPDWLPCVGCVSFCNNARKRKCCKAKLFGPPKGAINFANAEQYCQVLNCNIDTCPVRKPKKGRGKRYIFD